MSLIEEAVTAVCPMREAVVNARLEVRCSLKVIEKAAKMPPYPGMPRTLDVIKEMDCPPLSQALRDTLESRKWAIYVTYLRRKQKAAMILPSVVATSAALPLWWAPGKADLFYDHSNMWWLRGWEKGRKHQDPFLKIHEQFVPEKAPQPDRLQWGSCAVVGNSGLLLKSQEGAAISDHNTIIRINQAPWLHNYTNFIGNRTDVRVLNRKMTEMYATGYRKLIQNDANTTYVATRADVVSFKKLGIALQGQRDKNLLFNTQTVVAKGYQLLVAFREAFQQATGVTFKGGNSPSSGLVAAMIAIHMCSSVSLFGFALGNCMHGCPRYHYWSKGEGPERGSAVSYKGHQYDVEGWLIQALHVMGVICVVPAPSKLPPCGSRLGGLLGLDGRLLTKTLQYKMEKLLNNPRHLQALTLGKKISTTDLVQRGEKGRLAGKRGQHNDRQTATVKVQATVGQWKRRRGMPEEAAGG
mmetsp:Transcript_38083/g.107567  ORF Transcript_38083/g.107567 Transcript_38083/m.107567 type:complete len:468 (-) Transcript_38083:414-1817(-)